jgi:hypothetical protein
MGDLQCKIQTISEADQEEALEGDSHFFDRGQGHVRHLLPDVDQPTRGEVERAANRMPRARTRRPHLEHRAGVDGVDGLIRLEEGSDAWCRLYRGEAARLELLASLVSLNLIFGDPVGNGARVAQRRTAIGL